MTECSPRVRRVVVTGTFDVRNYGDLLFPLIAAHKLGDRGVTILPASPTARATGWRDTMPPADLRSALFTDEQFDGVLIGGGNIIHARPVTLPDYAIGDMANWAYGALWLGATLAAARRRVPVAWNAPGVPYPFDGEETTAVLAALAAASHVAVRDRASAVLLEPFQASVVPDTALDLAQLWPKRGLEEEFRDLLTRAGADPGARHVAIHVKGRSVSNEVEAIAPLVDAFCTASGRVPILIGIGPCHDDHVHARRLVQALTVPSVDLSEPLGLREIAAAIAWSDGYVGASMHGYVTAAAYGVAGVIIGKPRLSKMQGLLAHLGRETDEAADWKAGLSGMLARVGSPGPALPPQVRADLDIHWAAVDMALAGEALPGGAQAAFCCSASRNGTAKFFPS
jgi:polysaccharide pyruvyl transferase WcaK-like protein